MLFTADYGGANKTQPGVTPSPEYSEGNPGLSPQHRRTYPNSLDQLVARSDGRPPLLEGEEYAIIDPWWNRFNFEVVTDETGNERVVVGSPRPNDFDDAAKWRAGFHVVSRSGQADSPAQSVTLRLPDGKAIQLRGAGNHLWNRLTFVAPSCSSNR